MVGKSLGHYEIIEPLGSGGMGDVYRAHDPSLKRDIAVKLLPEDFAADPDRLARLEREAHSLAALNHPNVATIHGLEEADGIRFLVLELVEGETLADRLHAGALEVEDALGIAQQIAEGLEAAHTNGIIHRDLKPANIKITPEGRVKVLDFGLAKPTEREGAEGAETDALTHSPTLTVAGTAAGVLLGTAPYMSPEQAKGKPVDKRTDIWAFGCVLYELLAGRRPFVAEDVAETIAAILMAEPDWSLLPAGTPALTRSLLRRCLQKDPAQRLHDIADARIEIEEAQAEPSHVEAAASVVSRAGPSWQLAMSLLVLALLVGATAGVLGNRLSTPPAVQPVRAHLTLELEAGLRLWGGHGLEDEKWAFQRPSRTAIALSPDGKRLVYAATDGQSPQLYLRDMEQPSATPIPETEGGFSPFFSPGGERVGFFVRLEQTGAYALKVVPLGGGRPRTVVESIGDPEDRSDMPFGASWGDDDTIIYSPRESAGLWQVSAGGGEPEALTDLAGLYSHRLPTILPGSGAVVFTAQDGTGPRSARIVVQPLREDGSQKMLIENGSDPRYSATGHLIYMREGKLMAVPFDSERLEVVGDPVPVVEDVLQANGVGNSVLNSGAGLFTLSETGTLVYAPGGAYPEVPTLLAWVDRQGKAETVPLPARDYLFPRVSPDGRYLAYTAGPQIWVHDIALGTRRQLTFDGGAGYPVWSPDSTEIVFSSGGNLHRMPMDGSGQAEPLLEPGPRRYAASWSRRDFIAYVEDDDIWVLDLDQGTAAPFVDTPASDSHPIFSPDGAWLAYASTKDGQREIYVAPFPGAGPEKKVSIEGGSSPAWSANGRELFYRARRPEPDSPRQIWVADVIAGDTFEHERPRPLMEFEFDGTDTVNNFDVLSDGRFVMNPSDYEVEPLPVTKLYVVLNWFEELKQWVPTGR